MRTEKKWRNQNQNQTFSPQTWFLLCLVHMTLARNTCWFFWKVQSFSFIAAKTFTVHLTLRPGDEQCTMGTGAELKESQAHNFPTSGDLNWSLGKSPRMLEKNLAWLLLYCWVQHRPATVLTKLPHILGHPGTSSQRLCSGRLRWRKL